MSPARHCKTERNLPAQDDDIYDAKHRGDVYDAKHRGDVHDVLASPSSTQEDHPAAGCSSILPHSSEYVPITYDQSEGFCKPITYNEADSFNKGMVGTELSVNLSKGMITHESTGFSKSVINSQNECFPKDMITQQSDGFFKGMRQNEYGDFSKNLASNEQITDCFVKGMFPYEPHQLDKRISYKESEDFRKSFNQNDANDFNKIGNHELHSFGKGIPQDSIEFSKFMPPQSGSIGKVGCFAKTADHENAFVPAYSPDHYISESFDKIQPGRLDSNFPQEYNSVNNNQHPTFPKNATHSENIPFLYNPIMENESVCYNKPRPQNYFTESVSFADNGALRSEAASCGNELLRNMSCSDVLVDEEDLTSPGIIFRILITLFQ